jgi:hypothetical protein
MVFLAAQISSARRAPRCVRVAVVPLTLIAAMSIAACSSDKVSPSAATQTPSATAIATPSATPRPTAQPITSADYIQQANAICTAGTAKTDALGNGPGDPTQATKAQLPAFVSFLTSQANITEDELTQLRALPLPADGATKAQAAYDKVAELVTDVRAAAAAATAGDLAGYKTAIAKVVTDSDAANAQSNAAGLTVCGS